MGALNCKTTLDRTEEEVQLEEAREELELLRRKNAEQNETLEKLRGKTEELELLQRKNVEQNESLEKLRGKVEELRENLQRITRFSRTQQKEKREKEKENVRLARDNKYLEDRILAAQQVAVETQLRQLDELKSLTKETRELKQKLTLLQQQTATEEYRRGKYPVF